MPSAKQVKTVIAVFASDQQVQAAVKELTEANIPRSNISVISRTTLADEPFPSGSRPKTEPVLDTLGALLQNGIPHAQADTYEEGVQQGQIVVGVVGNPDNAEQICDILDRHDPLDVTAPASDMGSAPSGVGMSGNGPAETNAVRNNESGLTSASLSGGYSLAESMNLSTDETTETNAETTVYVGDKRNRLEGVNVVPKRRSQIF